MVGTGGAVGCGGRRSWDLGVAVAGLSGVRVGPRWRRVGRRLYIAIFDGGKAFIGAGCVFRV